MKNILIQTNSYFTAESWLSIIDDLLDEEDQKRISLIFVSSEEDIYTRLPISNICFAFFLPKFEKIRHLELMYLGISSVNYFDRLNLPESFNLRTSKGFASNIIAEHTLLMALSLIRKFPQAVLNQKRRKWDQSVFICDKVRSIRDYNVGILGLGNNGKAIAEIFGKIGCRVLGYANRVGDSTYVSQWYTKTDLNRFLSESEILIIALPLTNDTEHFINGERLDMMEKNSMIINIGRGEVIHEKDLYLALKRNQIKAAALDVFAKEPLSRWSKLWDLPNLIITPHIAGNIHFLTSEIQRNFISTLSIND